MSTSLALEAEIPSADWLTRFIEDIPTGVAVFDRDLRYLAANLAWAGAFDLTPLALTGQTHRELAGGKAAATLSDLLRRVLAGETVSGRHAIGAGDDTGQTCRWAVSLRPRRARDGSIVGVMAALHEPVPPPPNDPPDRTEPDGLTGIAGREPFLARLRAALAASAASRSGTALFLLNIDDFKSINDLYGTRIGDQVLKGIATRLMTSVRSRPKPVKSPEQKAAAGADLVARVSADEFGIVLGSAAPSSVDADAFARRLLQLVAPPVIVGEHCIRLTASVGYLITGRTHTGEDDILRDLNIALQEAKIRGPNSAKAWEPALTKTVGRRLKLLSELRRALDEGEFVLHYQPIVTLAEQRVVGAEALLRWNHPSEGLVLPQEFLPVLEESGLIVPVGRWVIREVVRQMQVWQMLYGRDILEWVSINVSARQFNDPALLLATLGEINDSGFPLDRLKLEITESAVMRNHDVTRAVLGELQEIGIRVALDDFGTGYSALGALRHYSVDTIKLDRDFTARLDTTDGRELVLALLSIARIYGASVVAEGVETVKQHEILQAAGCDFGQGYLFARPMDGSFLGAYALTHLVNADAAR